MNFDGKVSEKKAWPISKVVREGYINLYSELTPQEMRQIEYKELFKKQNQDWDESMVFLANELEKIAKEKGSEILVLDEGCGNGNFLIDENRSLIRWGVGIDVSKEFTRKNVCLDEIFEGDIENLPFEDNTFDVVTSLWVFEHVKNAEKVFSELKRVLKFDGVFIFATPNKSFLPLIIMRVLNFAKLNHFLNKFLFGRDSEDVFEAYYKANSIRDINRVISTVNNETVSSIPETEKSSEAPKLQVQALKYNFDPSYTSFNNFSYKLTCAMDRFFSLLKLSVFKAHIIGVIRKGF